LTNDISYLAQDTFFILSKPLLRYMEGDYQALIIFTELASLSHAFESTDQMRTSHGWFFRSVADLERDTFLSDYKQRAAIKKLEKWGFVQTRIAGNPAKRFFKVDHNAVQKALNKRIPVIEEPVSNKKELFYSNLNKYSNSPFEVFKTKTDNLKRPFVLFIYTWNNLYYKKYKMPFVWGPIDMGKATRWFNREPRDTFDYARLEDFFKKDNSTIDSWILYDRSNFEKDPAERVYDPRSYWK